MTDNSSQSQTIKFSEVKYGIYSYYSIVKPVTTTIILSALAVIYINTDETRKAGEAQLGTYTFFEVNTDDQSNAQNLGLSVANATIIVCGIGAMTFVIVLLYKYRCMKCLIGWMMTSSGLLLGFVGGSMFGVAIEKYQLMVDTFSYFFSLYNFALVGVISIFGSFIFSGNNDDNQTVVPTYITQGYLVCTSVLLAWQLSFFDSWTAWTLLVLLALYDLCAVLTPCGPLKALVNLMSKDDSPGIMPGLLYEAEFSSTHNSSRRSASIGSQRRRPKRQESSDNDNENNNDGNRDRKDNQQQDEEEATSPSETPESNDEQSTLSSGYEAVLATLASCQHGDSSTGTNANSTGVVTIRQQNEEEQSQQISQNTGQLPFAIAKIYRLKVLGPTIEARRPISDDEPLPKSPNDRLALQYSKEQLTTNVTAVFPRNGGRIDCVPSTSEGDDGPSYIVFDRNGSVRKTLVIDNDGKVYEKRTIINDGSSSEEEDAFEDRNSIKLGLGDFIFYSVLASKAAIYSFTSFAVCTLVIVCGLGSTLVLLSVFHHALPALPISIFLGVTFYLLTRYVIEPYIQDIFTAGQFYV